MIEKRALAVDLDGTLLLTDTLHELIFKFLSKNPLNLVKLLCWLSRGKASFKEKLAHAVALNVETLPLNQDLLDWLKTEKQAKRKIVLCTAANHKTALGAVGHLGLFDEVIASDERTNLSGAEKRRALEERFGVDGYDYVGNSAVDLVVWRGAKRAILANASTRVSRMAKKHAEIEKEFPRRPISVADWLSAFRIHQWLKNLLVFVPLITAHRMTDIEMLMMAALAFLSFSVGASSTYLINDLADLESDRLHPRKRFRPFASAALPLLHGAGIASLGIVASCALAMLVNAEFLLWLSLYLAMTLVYSFFLKRLVLVDGLTLAALYTIRIIAGAAATSVALSFWLLAFSGFIFLSLAFVKRYAELKALALEEASRTPSRGYLVNDAPLVQTMGLASGYIAVLVFVLYLQSDNVARLYSDLELMYGTVPLLFFWISWIWLQAHRGRMHDDPVVFSIKDGVSWLVGAMFVAQFLAASFWDVLGP